MDYQDITKRCGDCQNDFTVEAGEQEFYARKGFELPKRCADCREKKKNRFNSPFNGVAREMDNREHGNNRYDNKRKGGHKKHGLLVGVLGHLLVLDDDDSICRPH